MTTLEGENATIIQHCAVFGTLKTDARKFGVSEVRPHAQYSTSVTVSFVRPRKRNWHGFDVIPDNLRYLTIERDGKVLCDSRGDVPCDMVNWEKVYQRHRGEWLARQAELDAENAKRPGVTAVQMGNFRD